MEIIWTNHLLQRIKERQINSYEVEKVIRFPDFVEKSQTESSQKFIKKFANYSLVAAVKQDANKWIVTSVWKKANNYQGHKYQPSMLERLVYQFVVWLEKVIRASFNR